MQIEIIEVSSKLPSAEKRALAKAVQAAREHNCPVTVLVPAKKYAKTTPLKYLLSEQEVEALLKGQSVYLSDDVLGHLESNSTITTKPHPQVLLVIRGWSEAIQKIQKVSGVCSLVVVPPSGEEATKWRDAFNETQT